MAVNVNGKVYMIGMSLGVVADLQDRFGDLDTAYESFKSLKSVLEILAIFMNDAIVWESDCRTAPEEINARYLGAIIGVDETAEIISKMAEAMGVTMPQSDDAELNDAEKELEEAFGSDDGETKNAVAE